MQLCVLRNVSAVLSLVFSASGVAHCGELHLLLNGKAIHIDPPDGADYNEKNWGSGLQYDFERSDSDWIGFVNTSAFDDSNRNTSWYTGGGTVRRFALFKSSRLHLDLGAIAFIMKRKGFQGGDPFFGVLPVASIGTDRIAVNLTYVPKVDPKMVPLVFLQLKIRLGQLGGG